LIAREDEQMREELKELRMEWGGDLAESEELRELLTALEAQ
jgi:hypothetical protein